MPEVPSVPDVPFTPLVPSVPEVPFTPEVPSVPFVPLVPSVPSVPDVPLVPFTPDVPSVPFVPEVPLTPLVPSVPLVPLVPEVPSVPLLPVTTNEHITSSLLENGDVAELASIDTVKSQYEPSSFKSEIANNKNWDASNLFDILIWPFTAEVELSTVCKNDSILFPPSSVALIYTLPARVWVELFNLTFPVPGLASAVPESKV